MLLDSVSLVPFHVSEDERRLADPSCPWGFQFSRRLSSEDSEVANLKRRFCLSFLNPDWWPIGQ